MKEISMIPVVHKVNDVEILKRIPTNHGLEIDLRQNNGQIILNHEISPESEGFENFLIHYKHKLLVLNIKESGIEDQVISILKKNNIKDYFLLDIEFPYLLMNYKNQGNSLSLRFSTYESIQSVVPFKDYVDWLWVDTYESLTINSEIAEVLKSFKICLVSPSRWGKPEKLKSFIEIFEKFNIPICAILIEEHEKITK